MESDRLLDSVFREFYSERDVVHEERRLRTESTPTGVFQEQFDAMFWQSSPYSWPVIGWTSDLNSYTREEAQRYFDIYYRPNNLVGVVVGDFDPAQVKPLIREYFGRLKRGETEPPPVVTLEMPQTVEQRMYAECDCQPQIEIRYHTVPFNHADSFALEMMAGILNGRTGRLYKSMVEGQQIASSAAAGTSAFGGPSKYAGYFSFTAEVKGDAKPEQLETAWYAELERLQKEPVPDRELQKVKNQEAADAYRRLQGNFFLMLQLGYYEGLGSWRYVNDSPARLQAVTAADIQNVARKYFEKTNRAVAIYTRKSGSTEIDSELAAMDPQKRAVAMQALKEMEKYDADSLRRMISEMESRIGQVPPQFADVMQYIMKKAKTRLEGLDAGTIPPPPPVPPPG
jgi:predicted Zn-dependent peptidase